MPNALQIKTLSGESEWPVAFEVLKQLRTHLDYENFVSTLRQISTPSEDSYKIILAYQNQTPVGFMGYRLLTDFVHGKHVYVDDLVVDKDHRSSGIGAHLLQHAEQIAHEFSCAGLRLCTGIENEAGKKFYEREGWHARALAFKKKRIIK